MLDPADVAAVLGLTGPRLLPHLRQAPGRGGDGTLAGLTYQTATIDTAGTILSLSVVDKAHAAPGTAVTVVWGEHPGRRHRPGCRPRLPADPRDGRSRAL